LVEDEPEVARALRRQLRAELPGIRLELASNLTEAYAAVACGAIDAVVSDLDLGAEDGAALLQSLAVTDGSPLRVVYSARADHGGARDAARFCDRVFGKSGGPEPLVAYLRERLVPFAVAPRQSSPGLLR